MTSTIHFNFLAISKYIANAVSGLIENEFNEDDDLLGSESNHSKGCELFSNSRMAFGNKFYKAFKVVKMNEFL